MRITLVSDAHLHGIDDPAQHAAVAFLRAWPSDVWVFAGDWFDFWWGSDAVVDARFVPFLAALGDLRRGGARSYWLGGNRDFVPGGALQREVEALDRWTDRYGARRFLAVHGDVADASVSHRVFSRLVRSDAVRWLAARSGAETMIRVGGALGRWSRAHGAADPSALVDAQRKWVDARFDEADVVFTGHSHTPGVEQRPGGLWVNLGDWAEHRTFATIDDGEVGLWQWDGVQASAVSGGPRRRSERIADFKPR
jgi:UDP-2,3-diacylglucosamine pyrophosphatase LpxH